MSEREPMPMIAGEQIMPEQNREQERPLTEEIFKWWRGDAHTHSKESTREDFRYAEGIYDLQEIMQYYQNLGLEFVCFVEHSSDPGAPEWQLPSSLVCQSLLTEIERITELNQTEKYRAAALSGVEANLLFGQDAEKTIDLPPEILEKLDLVIASRHQMAEEISLDQIKDKFQAAAENPWIDVLGHPDRFIRAEYYTESRYNWNRFKEYFPEAEEINLKMRQLQNNQKNSQSEKEKQLIQLQLQQIYDLIDKTIGKKFFSLEDQENPELSAFRQKFLKFESDELYWQKARENYWQGWSEIFETMAAGGKAFEINLNAEPQEELVKLAAEKGVKFFLNFDAHDFGQYQWQKTELTQKGEKAKKAWAEGVADDESLATLEKYKAERLAHGPGVRAILRLVRWIKRLESFDVTPDRVVNSSKEHLLRFLTEERGKRTNNLIFLTEKYLQDI